MEEGYQDDGGGGGPIRRGRAGRSNRHGATPYDRPSGRTDPKADHAAPGSGGGVLSSVFSAAITPFKAAAGLFSSRVRGLYGEASVSPKDRQAGEPQQDAGATHSRGSAEARSHALGEAQDTAQEHSHNSGEAGAAHRPAASARGDPDSTMAIMQTRRGASFQEYDSQPGPRNRDSFESPQRGIATPGGGGQQANTASRLPGLFDASTPGPAVRSLHGLLLQSPLQAPTPYERNRNPSASPAPTLGAWRSTPFHAPQHAPTPPPASRFGAASTAVVAAAAVSRPRAFEAGPSRLGFGAERKTSPFGSSTPGGLRPRSMARGLPAAASRTPVSHQPLAPPGTASGSSLRPTPRLGAPAAGPSSSQPAAPVAIGWSPMRTYNPLPADNLSGLKRGRERSPTDGLSLVGAGMSGLGSVDRGGLRRTRQRREQQALAITAAAAVVVEGGVGSRGGMAGSSGGVAATGAMPAGDADMADAADEDSGRQTQAAAYIMNLLEEMTKTPPSGPPDSSDGRNLASSLASAGKQLALPAPPSDSLRSAPAPGLAGPTQRPHQLTLWDHPPAQPATGKAPPAQQWLNAVRELDAEPAPAPSGQDRPPVAEPATAPQTSAPPSTSAAAPEPPASKPAFGGLFGLPAHTTTAASTPVTPSFMFANGPASSTRPAPAATLSLLPPSQPTANGGLFKFGSAASQALAPGAQAAPAPKFDFEPPRNGETNKVIASMLAEGVRPAEGAPRKFSFDGPDANGDVATPMAAPKPPVVSLEAAASGKQSELQLAAGTPLPADSDEDSDSGDVSNLDSENEEPTTAGGAKPAPAAAAPPSNGGWGAAFLSQNATAAQKATAAAAEEAAKKAGAATAAAALPKSSAPAAGGWGLSFLQNNAQQAQKATDAAAEEAAKKAGATGTSAPAFKFGTTSSAPASADTGLLAHIGALKPGVTSVSAPSTTSGTAAGRGMGVGTGSNTGASAAASSSAASAPAASGWGSALLASNAAAAAKAQADIQKKIEEEKGGGGSTSAAVSAPARAFQFGLPPTSAAAAPASTAAPAAGFAPFTFGTQPSSSAAASGPASSAAQGGFHFGSQPSGAAASSAPASAPASSPSLAGTGPAAGTFAFGANASASGLTATLAGSSGASPLTSTFPGIFGASAAAQTSTAAPAAATTAPFGSTISVPGAAGAAGTAGGTTSALTAAFGSTGAAPVSFKFGSASASSAPAATTSQSAPAAASTGVASLFGVSASQPTAPITIADRHLSHQQSNDSMMSISPTGYQSLGAAENGPFAGGGSGALDQNGSGSGTLPPFGGAGPTGGFAFGASGSAAGTTASTAASTAAPSFGWASTGPMTFGASSMPAFAASSAPAFGSSAPATNTGSVPSFAAGSAPAFGTGSSTSGFGYSAAGPSFGAASGSAPGGGGAFGAGSTGFQFGGAGSATVTSFGAAQNGPAAAPLNPFAPTGQPGAFGGQPGGQFAFGQGFNAGSQPAQAAVPGFGPGGAQPPLAFGGPQAPAFGAPAAAPAANFGGPPAAGQPGAPAFGFPAAAPGQGGMTLGAAAEGQPQRRKVKAKRQGR